MKHLIKIVSLALCAAFLLSMTAYAAQAAPDSAVPALLTPVRLWGPAARQEDGSLLLQNSDPEGYSGEIVVHLSDETCYVDGETGLPLDMEQVKDGDTLYIWAGPAMTMSLPPQTNAVVVVGNVPAEGVVPQYAEISAPASPDAGGEKRRVPIAGGELTVLESAEVTPYQTKNRVTLDDLTPGAQILAWPDAGGRITRVVLFPYAYRGYLTAGADGAVSLNGEELDAAGRVLPVEDTQALYLPLRAVAEAAGYTVEWVSGRGAVVSASGTELFSVRSGGNTAQTGGDERGLLGACVVDRGVTYLPAGDLAGLLQLYYYNV